MPNNEPFTDTGIFTLTLEPKTFIFTEANTSAQVVTVKFGLKSSSTAVWPSPEGIGIRDDHLHALSLEIY